MRVVHVRAGPAAGSASTVLDRHSVVAALSTQPAVEQRVLVVGRDRRVASALPVDRRVCTHERHVSTAGAAPALAALVKDWGPDLVHLHSTRGSGSELLGVARAGGAAVVVSMHDLGWICERGTCIDGAGTSCIPAVAPGSCACRRGTHPLAERNAHLRRALRPEDTVLAPTHEIAGRLRAGGIDAQFDLYPVAPQRDPTTAGADLLSYYRAALDRRDAKGSRDPRPDRLPRQVLFIVGAWGPPLHYRVHQKVEQLALRGVESRIRWYSDPRLSTDLRSCDVLIVYRSPATRQLIEQVREARRRDIATFFDVDDLVFDAELIDTLPIHEHRSRKERDEWIDAAHRYAAVMAECGAGIASTPEIARHMRRFGIPAQVHPNGVDTTLAVLSERARRTRGGRRDPADPFTIGYCSGTDTHDPDLALIGGVLAEFLTAHPASRLVLMGPLAVPPALEPHRSRVVQRGVVPAAEFPDHLARLDLNLAPLVASAFTNCKSAIKWSEAALVGVPTLASATEPFRDAIRPRRTGLLADSREAFGEELAFAAREPAALAEMTTAARLAACEQGSTWVLGDNLLRILTTSSPAPQLSHQNDWAPESWVTDVDPPRLVAGLVPTEKEVGPGERLDGVRAGFVLPSDRGPLRRVDVHVATWVQPASRAVAMTIAIGDRTLAEAMVEPADIDDGGWVAFDLGRALRVPRGAVAVFSSESGQNVTPYVMREGSRLVDGVEVPGGLRVRTFHEPPVPPEFAQAPPPVPVAVRAEQWFSTHLRPPLGKARRRLRRFVPERIRGLLRGI